MKPRPEPTQDDDFARLNQEAEASLQELTETLFGGPLREQARRILEGQAELGGVLKATKNLLADQGETQTAIRRGLNGLEKKVDGLEGQVASLRTALEAQASPGDRLEEGFRALQASLTEVRSGLSPLAQELRALAEARRTDQEALREGLEGVKARQTRAWRLGLLLLALVPAGFLLLGLALRR